MVVGVKQVGPLAGARGSRGGAAAHAGAGGNGEFYKQYTSVHSRLTVKKTGNFQYPVFLAL